MSLPGTEDFRRSTLVEVITEAGREGISGERLAELWRQNASLAGVVSGAKGATLTADLQGLESTGAILHRGGRWIAVRFSGLILGSLQHLDRGDALLRTGEAREVGWRVAKTDLHGALDGDWVLAKNQSRSRGRGRRQEAGQLPFASVVRVLKSPWDELVVRVDKMEQGGRPSAGGRPTKRQERGASVCVPFDSRLDHEVVIEASEDLKPGDFAVVAVERGQRGRKRLRARLLERLGSIDEPGVDVQVMIRHYGIPSRFPEAVSRQATALPQNPGQPDFVGRIDLRQQVVVTIDGETARDFDDAISVQPLPAGKMRLGIHIADVSHYVAEGSVLDLEAFRRGTSVYYPDCVFPMFPEALSNGLCSLRPDVPRLTMSAFLDLDEEGEVIGRSFANSVVQSSRRLTYDEVRDRLTVDKAKKREGVEASVQTLLQQAEVAMHRLLSRRRQNGSLDFDLPAGDVVLDTDGRMVGVQAADRHVAHRIVEEFMIAANEAVAFELTSHEQPSLYRAHDPPQDERLEELADVLRPLGLSLPTDSTELAPAALQELLSAVAGTEEEGFVSSLVLRSLQRAEYRPSGDGHYALSSRHYTHFTSPIRRYPDLLVHRALKQLPSCQGTSRPEPSATEKVLPLADRLAAIGRHASATERRAERSERELLQWKKVRFLQSRVGEHFPGRITGVKKFGFFVQLTEFFVDGLVPIFSLNDDYYAYDPATHRLEGASSERRFQLADAVEVVLVGVDERSRGLQLELADLHGRTGRGASGRGGRGRGPDPRRRQRGRPGPRRR